MEIRKYDNIRFGAKLLKPRAFVDALDTVKKQYTPAEISCVQFNPKNDDDFHAIKKAGKYWIKGFAGNIEYAAEKIRYGTPEKRKNKILGITTQTNDFGVIDDKKLLLLCEIKNVTKDILEIVYLQANPNIIYKTCPLFKHIGTSFMNILKQLYPKKILVAKSAYTATGFYEKNDFSIIDQKKLLYMYLPKAYKTGELKLKNK